MREQNTAGPIETRPERRRGLADQIAMARARRNEAILTREDFEADTVAPAHETSESKHQDLRADLRRIISEDAERAANESRAPSMEEVEVTEEITIEPRRHGRFKVASYWLGCVLGLGAVAYGLTRPA